MPNRHDPSARPAHAAPNTSEAVRPASPLQGPAAPIDPAQAVAPREGAAADPAALHVRDDAAVKHNVFASAAGHPSGRAHWQTHLHVEAWVRNTTFEKRVWADVHVFGHDGALVTGLTCPSAYARPAGDGGDLFCLDGIVYEGATATPGSVEPRPDVRLVQYRVYAEFDGRVWTDGELHECVLKADVISR